MLTTFDSHPSITLECAFEAYAGIDDRVACFETAGRFSILPFSATETRATNCFESLSRKGTANEQAKPEKSPPHESVSYRKACYSLLTLTTTSMKNI
jgi:hypothetical protein